MPTVNPTYIAGTTINPCRIVTMTPAIADTHTTTPTAAFTVWPALSGDDEPVGISQEGTSDWQSTDAAGAGEQIRIFGPGEVCLLELGANTTVGQYVMATTGGKGTPVTADEDRAIGFALEGGSSGDKIQVYVHPVHWHTGS